MHSLSDQVTHPTMWSSQLTITHSVAIQSYNGNLYLQSVLLKFQSYQYCHSQYWMAVIYFALITFEVPCNQMFTICDIPWNFPQAKSIRDLVHRMCTPATTPCSNSVSTCACASAATCTPSCTQQQPLLPSYALTVTATYPLAGLFVSCLQLPAGFPIDFACWKQAGSCEEILA